MSTLNKIKHLLKGSDRTANVTKNILASLCIKILSIIVSFMLVPLTIGYVSSDLYGVWLTLSSILTWFCFMDIGFSQGLKNKLAEAIAHRDLHRAKSLISTTYFMMILIFVPICLILEFVVPVIEWCSLLNVDLRYENEIIKTMHILIAMVCLQMVVNVLISVVAAFQKVALSQSFLPIGNLISLIVIYILTKTCPPSLFILALSLASMPILVTAIASFILFSSLFKDVSPSLKFVKTSLVKHLFNLGYKFFIINIQVVVLYQSTNILISNISSPNEVTSYNVAYKLLSVSMMIFNIIMAPLWPAYTDAYTKGDYNWMKRMRKKMQNVFVLSVLICGLTVLSSPIIYNLWLGNTVTIPYTMTLLVAIYVCIYCWMTLNGTLVIGMGKVKIQCIDVIIGMITHIPLSLFLSVYIGVYGIIVSMIVINLFYGIMMNIQIKRLLNNTAYGIWNE